MHLSSLPFVLVTTWILTVYCDDELFRIGNKIQGSDSGVDVPGAIFLIDEEVSRDGILFAYSAYFRAKSAVKMQVWGPVLDAPNDFMLKWELSVKPTGVGREDIYIYLASQFTENCVRVKKGDRMGIMFEEAPGAVSFTFDASSPRALGLTKTNDSAPHQIGDTISFSSLVFPYDFAAAAHIVVEHNVTSDDTVVECPTNLFIPNYEEINFQSTSSIAPPTGRPGDIGATGPVGATGYPGLQGDTGATGPRGDDGTAGIEGPTGEIGPNGATGATGPAGPQGYTGFMGSTGAKGEKGDEGPVGPAGAPGPVVTVQMPLTGQVIREQTVFESPMMSLSMVIWLAILTALVVILLIIIIVLCHKKANKKKDSPPKIDNLPKRNRFSSRIKSYIYEQPDNPDIEGQPSWVVGTLKTESESVYSVDTIRSDADKSYNSTPGSSELGHANGGLDSSDVNLVTANRK